MYEYGYGVEPEQDEDPPMKIAFTGHRDKRCDGLILCNLIEKYPNAVFVHGGAPGFDTQVNEMCKAHEVVVQVIRPDFKRYPPNVAPLRRNDDIIAGADLLVACYDGRQYGGTFYTVNKARELGIEVMIVEPMELQPKEAHA